MKKKTLKSLDLNKKVVSRLNKEKINGGVTNHLCAAFSIMICPSGNCISGADSGELVVSCNDCDQN